MKARWHPLEFLSSPFDPTLAYVSSSVPILRRPIILASVRLLLALYALVTLLVSLVWAGVVLHDVDGYFSYFTHLTYIGLCSYFFASGVQTLVYARNGTYLLRTWPFSKTLQFLHIWLHSTVVTFPFVVTITFWVLLSSPSTFSSTFDTWSNISVHALNSLYALFEVLLANTPPPPPIFLLANIVLLGAYLGVAYITHATQGFYTYDFLDPQQQGSFLAAYIVGIAVGYIVAFGVVFGIMVIRRRVASKVKYNKVEGEKEMMARQVQADRDVEGPQDGNRW
ncbi:uncharacterized protein BT62DRAFT_900955 [Guyanagaster necrorhizus]|uniref:FAR-17a/AIG1-like protein n=1 Tax=Guyanagaster necrorhizus TaxID=856835 RepID=A0A9P8AQQ1_9AGAR|nr:uncharacterized protein BT62DRAFT_900955 [Guyanagaster necrorhizus MCA 3950]KAG7444096.1 hypothetical protein BT62DRAFT_900955 [Guyanagaster necrorhizus MCA 3950]